MNYDYMKLVIQDEFNGDYLNYLEEYLKSKTREKTATKDDIILLNEISSME